MLTLEQIEKAFTNWWGTEERLADAWHSFAVELIPLIAEKKDIKC